MTVMLYRPGERPNPHVWDLPVETGIFSEQDVPAALDSGWSRHPHDVGASPDVSAEQPKRRGRPPKEG